MILPALQGHDPAVQKLGRRDFLPSKIVNQIDAVIGLQMTRRVIDFCRRVETQLQHFEAKLASRRDERTLASHPSAVIWTLQAEYGGRFVLSFNLPVTP